MQELHPAKLVVISGVLTGEVFSLESSTITVGRDSSNTIGLPDAALSRLHCVFSLEGESWNVRDAGSSNGTFVNGQKIQQQRLSHGDRISAGACALLFVRDPASDVSVDVDESASILPTTRLSLEDVSYLKPPHSSSLPSRERHLQALLAISTAIHEIRDEARLSRELLDALFDALPVRQGTVLRSTNDATLETQAVRPDSRPDAVRVHVETVRRAMREGAGILCATTTPAAGSVRVSDATGGSVMAVPLSLPERSLGAIYLTSKADAAFTEEHLQLATAVARIAATALDNIRQRTALERETDRLQADLHLANRMIVGESRTLQAIEALVTKIAKVNATVLVLGETGTGKELVARAIHLQSPRARRPFVAINCAALSETLLESELFGHERGAFTGAVGQKKGRIELADGGTVFLDEVGELSLGVQSKLLRVLQEREIERVGGTRPIAVDVRILAATNRDLDACVASGTFRRDLFFRLNVVRVDLPPLRDRREDIPHLAEHFRSVYSRKSGRPVSSISAAAMQRLIEYDWPGNVRELENAIERACVLGSSDAILQEDLPDNILDTAMATQVSGPPDLHASVTEAKRQAVIAAFRRSGGNYTETAKLLGVHPNYLHRLVRNLKIKAILDNEGD